MLQALRYAVCKVLKVSYGAAKFIVIFGYRERLDGDLMGPTDRRVAQSLKQGNPVMTQETEGVAQSLVLGEVENLDHQFQRRQDLLQGIPAMTQETEGNIGALILSWIIAFSKGL